MKSLLKEIESKFIELEESLDAVDHENNDNLENSEEIEEQNVTGAIAGYSTPAAFAKPGKWQNKDKTYESVNTPPEYSWKDEDLQTPESEEEELSDKFAFSDTNDWFNKTYEYPLKYMLNKPTKHAKDKTIKQSVAEIMDHKYESLIESYRTYATGNAKTTPEQKIKHTIKEVARQLQEIERTVKYASRLKTESGVARNGYGASVDSALTKISERLIKISERVRALGE